MKEITKITFGAPRHIPSSIDGIEFLYPYELRKIVKEEFKIDQETAELKYVKASISGSMAITWGFQIWRPETEYDDLKKILFRYVLEHIKEKIKDATLQDMEQVVILSSNHPSKRIYDVNKIPEVYGYEEEIEIEDKTKTIEDQLSENLLADDIIQHRDNINAVFYNKYSEKLIDLDQERNLLDFFKPAKSKEDFSYRIASLGSLVGKLNKRVLTKILGIPDSPDGTISLLEKYIKSIEGDVDKIIPPLKHINRLRQAYPIHTDKATGVIDAHNFFNLEYPLTNFDEAWKRLLEAYLKSLKLLFELLKAKIFK